MLMCITVITGGRPDRITISRKHVFAQGRTHRLQRSGGYSAEFGEDGAGGRCVCAALSMDDQMAVSGGTDNSVKLWDVPSGRCLMALDGHNERVRGVAFSSANHSVASVADDGCARVWHVSPRSTTM